MSIQKFFLIVFLFLSSNCATAQVDTLDLLFRNSFEVFQSLRNDKGVYRDSKVFEGEDFHPSSVAATGMGLISLCIADAMGWIDDAEEQAILTIETMSGLTPGFTPDRNENGFYRHWIDMETGDRAWDSEYSTIDSGILYAGILFAYKYFCGSGSALESLVINFEYDPLAATNDPIDGSIFLKMNADGSGDESALTLPFNEYMIAAWLTDVKSDHIHKGAELWNNHYFDPDALTKNNYQGIDVLTDNPNGYLSSFVIQFPYYLVHDFTTDDRYIHYLKNARTADSIWWANENKGASYQWGLGAGSSNNSSGYHADKINDNPSHIHSPHIIAGFLPVSPGDTVYLKQQYKEGSNLYTLPNTGKPNTGKQVLWRKSLTDPNYTANEIQGIDYSTMLFGLATLDRFLGKDFFSTYNDFYEPPCGRLNSSIHRSKPIEGLFKAYPNPASSDQLRIVLDDQFQGDLILEVFDEMGRNVFHTSINKTTNELEYGLSTSTWGKGIYVIMISGKEIRGSLKVVR